MYQSRSGLVQQEKPKRTRNPQPATRNLPRRFPAGEVFNTPRHPPPPTTIRNLTPIWGVGIWLGERKYSGLFAQHPLLRGIVNPPFPDEGGE